MKKALIVANLGGFSSFLIRDMELLKAMGYALYYAANTELLPWENMREYLVNNNICIVHIDFDSKKPCSKKNINAFSQIKKLIKKEKFDVIHCHTPIAGLLTRVAAIPYRKKGTKVIYTAHGFAFSDRSSFKNKLIFKTCEYICSWFSDVIITINQEDYNAAQKMYCKNVFYIPGVGVDIERYAHVQIDRQAYREMLGINEHEIMILSVGELSKRKNHQVIIAALGSLQAKDKYVYVICGNGVEGGTGKLLIQKAKEKNVKLKLLGFRTDIPEIIHCSDIGAIPSVREGLGLAGIQSLAGGVPLVGTPVQGIKDYLLEGVTGFLCDAFDEMAYAAAIEKLAAMDMQQRLIMSKNCNEQAKQFDISLSKKAMKNIYEQVLSNKYDK